ncbi:hypothetical protein ACH5AO_25155 [Streptomyces sp. NPDC018964]|uniref:hypothetical protein n=1 Tax=unclassified Streptomyces TaxID=2593676 RepID=UPI0037B46737
MSSVCFQVPGEIAWSVKHLPDDVQRLTALLQYFEQSVGPGETRTLLEDGRVVRQSSPPASPPDAETGRRASAAPARETPHDTDELGRRPGDAAQGPSPVVRMALAQDARVQELNRKILREEVDRLRAADLRYARLRAVLASYDSPASPDEAVSSDGTETGRAAGGPPRSVEPAGFQTVLAGLDGFGVYRTDTGPSGTAWKEP